MVVEKCNAVELIVSVKGEYLAAWILLPSVGIAIFCGYQRRV